MRRAGELRRRSLLAAAGLVLAVLVTGFAWVLASPVGSSPDDTYHQTSIWCPPPVERSGCPLAKDSGGAVVGVRVPPAVAYSSCYALKSDESAACLREVSPTGTAGASHVDRGQYPGAYYHVMNLFAGDDVTRSVLLMRAANVVLAVLLIGSAAAMAAPATRRLIAFAVLGTWVPLGLFVVASVNPSSWAVTGVSAAWLAMHVLLLATRRRVVIGASLLLVLAAAVAAGSRGDAGAYVLLVGTAAVALHGRRALRRWRRLGAPVVASAIAAVSVLGAGQVEVLGSGFAGDTERRPGQVFFENVTELPGLLAGTLGAGTWGLGWLDTRMPAVTWVATVAVAAGLCLLGLSELTGRKAVALALLLGGLVAVPLQVLQASLNVVGENVQPRYLLPLLPVLVGTFLAGGTAAGVVPISRSQAAAAYSLLTVAHAFALHANIRRYVTGQDVVDLDLDAGVEWWWEWAPSPMQVWLAGSLGFAVLALSLFAAGPPVARRPGHAEPLWETARR